MKKKILWAVVISFVLVIALSLVFYHYFYSPLSTQDISACSEDSECIIVEYDGCCSSMKAINKNYLEEYLRYRLLHSVGRGLCDVASCMSPPDDPVARCIQKSLDFRGCDITERE